MPGWVKALAAIVGLAIVVYVVIVIIRPTQDDCDLLVKQKTATIDLQATVRISISSKRSSASAPVRCRTWTHCSTTSR